MRSMILGQHLPRYKKCIIKEIQMAIIKHIAMKTSKYSEAYNYLVFKHDEFTQKEVVDVNGNHLMRDDYWIDGINCDPYSYDLECCKTNRIFHKNQSYDEIKQHHYIISFDPKDVDECGLTGEKAQAIGLDYAKANFPGHQAIVCTHLDGHNHSGNIHVNIVFNGVRKLDVDKKPFMERGCDSRAGYKHHVTKKLLAHLKSELMKTCQEKNLHQVDLLHHAKKRVTTREYYASKRGIERNRRLVRKTGNTVAQSSFNSPNTIKPDETEAAYTPSSMDSTAANSQNTRRSTAPTKFETRKDYLRRAVSDCAAAAADEKSFASLLRSKYSLT